jgi:16S rRNA (cytosine967-C5)-methyltransferase
MDRVLIDAPCTGTGTWRRRPDAKWRLSAKAIGDRAAEQATLLDSAVNFLKPDGSIAYVTCSLLPDENGEQVAAFIARHPGFAAAPGAEIVAASSLLPEGRAALVVSALMLPAGLILSPRRTGTDGFFVAVLRRA